MATGSMHSTAGTRYCAGNIHRQHLDAETAISFETKLSFQQRVLGLDNAQYNST